MINKLLSSTETTNLSTKFVSSLRKKGQLFYAIDASPQVESPITYGDRRFKQMT